MFTGLTVTVIVEECHPFPTIFITALKRLMRHLLVHEGALALEKERSAFYEKNMAFMGLATATFSKSLKHLA